MCSGIFSNSLLTVNARILLNGTMLPTQSHAISFLLDTGAEATILDPTDAILQGIDINILEENPEEIYGIGGSCPTRILPSVRIAFFNTAKIFFEYHTEYMDQILVGDPQKWSYGSIIGKDLWTRFNISTDLEHNSFTLIRIKSKGPQPISFKISRDVLYQNAKKNKINQKY